MNSNWGVVRINPTHQDLVDQVDKLTEWCEELENTINRLEDRVWELEILTSHLGDKSNVKD
jgi:aromatic ring hydroxylase